MTAQLSALMIVLSGPVLYLHLPLEMQRVFYKSFERIFTLANKYRIFHAEQCILCATSPGTDIRWRGTIINHSVNKVLAQKCFYAEKWQTLTSWLRSPANKENRNDWLRNTCPILFAYKRARSKSVKRIFFAVKYSFYVVPYWILIGYLNILFISTYRVFSVVSLHSWWRGVSFLS